MHYNIFNRDHSVISSFPFIFYYCIQFTLKENKAALDLYVTTHVSQRPIAGFKGHTHFALQYVCNLFSPVRTIPHLKLLLKTFNVLERIQIYHAKIAAAYFFITGCLVVITTLLLYSIYP